MIETYSPEGLAHSPASGGELLSFVLGEDLYAIELSRVRQILEVAALTPVPGMPPFFAGLASYHGRAVPVVDLARKFALGDRSRDDAAQTAVLIVDARVQGEVTLMGVLVHRLADLLDASSRFVAPTPVLGSRLRAEYVRGVLANEERFTLVLDLDRMLTASEAEVLGGLSSDQSPAGGESTPAGEVHAHSVPLGISAAALLLFAIGGQPLTVPLVRIREILEWLPVTPVPGAPAFVRGAANVRGLVVPVVDLAQRFGLPELPVTDRTCLLVTETEALGERVALALIADSVDQVIERDEALQAVPPEFGTPIPPQFLCGLVRQSEGFVPVLDLDRTLEASVLRADSRRA